MNILPKKKWHVRTKENVARVLKDEEEARIQDTHEKERIALAESEVRLDLLRKQSSLKYQGNSSTAPSLEHVNLFSGSENKTKNVEATEERNNDQKDWEIKVGYLKPLGLGSTELNSDKPWYQKTGEELSKATKRQKKFDTTDLLDPLTEMKKRGKYVDYATPIPNTPETIYVDIDFHDKVTEFSNDRRKYGQVQSQINQESTIRNHSKKTKHKKKKSKKRHRSSSSESSDNEDSKVKMKKLRDERLKREQSENVRTLNLLKPKSSEASSDLLELQIPKMKQKYNSQFNPHHVKSNYR